MLTIRSWDLPARTQLFGKTPLFIFDPRDKSNEAVDEKVDPLREAGANALAQWPIYPQFFRDAFTQAFTEGLTDPTHGRVKEGEWIRLLSQLRDSVFYCCCQAENFYDPNRTADAAAGPARCWSCKQELRLPFRIRLERSIIMLTHEGRLYPHHLGQTTEFDFSKSCGEVVPHPKAPGVWGLKNCTDQKWVATTPDSNVKEIEPGRSVVLADRTKVDFGKVQGEISY